MKCWTCACLCNIGHELIWLCEWANLLSVIWYALSHDPWVHAVITVAHVFTLTTLGQVKAWTHVRKIATHLYESLIQKSQWTHVNLLLWTSVELLAENTEHLCRLCGLVKALFLFSLSLCLHHIYILHFQTQHIFWIYRLSHVHIWVYTCYEVTNWHNQNKEQMVSVTVPMFIFTYE